MKRSQRQRKKEKQKNQRKQSISGQKASKPLVNVKENSFYENNYKKLIIIPALLLIIALILLSVKMINTGEIINKGISLSGGVSVTVIKEDINKDLLLQDLENAFPEFEVNVRNIEDSGRRIGVLVETNMPPENNDDVQRFSDLIKNRTGASGEDLSTETMGSSLGDAFFKQTIVAVLFAFFFMGIVIFLYFKSFVPSALTILSAFSDIVITLAIINILGLSIGTAGIAAFLMLIGYSVDANIVLNTRTLKEASGTISEQIKGAFSTGLTMSVTTLVAITVAFIIADSPVLKEIMLIMIIGLLVDIITTWIQNAGLLRMYLENKKKKVD